MQAVMNYILNNLGSSVFMPAVMILIGLAIRMRVMDSISSGLMLGVALIGMSMGTAYLVSAMGPVVQAFSVSTGTNLTTVDVGWAAVSAIVWAWPYVLLMFPLFIGINLFMLGFKLTNCLNIDMWNVWEKACTAFLVTGVTGSVVIGLAAGCVQTVVELLNADAQYYHVKRLTGVPGVSCPHPQLIASVLIYPVDLLLRKIPGLNKDINADALRAKYGSFFENHIIGFIVGTIMALIARLPVAKCLQIGVQLGAMLFVLPMLAKLFMQALAPISEAVGEKMKNRFPGRDFTIGLDWPFMGGRSELWLAKVIVTPLCLIMAVMLPGNTVLPIAALGGVYMLSCMVITNANLIRMIILGLLFQPIVFYTASYFAPIITAGARAYGTLKLLPGQTITRLSAGGDFGYVLGSLGKVFQGNFLGILLFAGWVLLAIFYFRGFKKEAKKIREEEEGAEDEGSRAA